MLLVGSFFLTGFLLLEQMSGGHQASALDDYFISPASTSRSQRFLPRVPETPAYRYLQSNCRLFQILVNSNPITFNTCNPSSLPGFSFENLTSLSGTISFDLQSLAVTKLSIQCTGDLKIHNLVLINTNELAITTADYLNIRLDNIKLESTPKISIRTIENAMMIIRDLIVVRDETMWSVSAKLRSVGVSGVFIEKDVTELVQVFVGGGGTLQVLGMDVRGVGVQCVINASKMILERIRLIGASFFKEIILLVSGEVVIKGAIIYNSISMADYAINCFNSSLSLSNLDISVSYFKQSLINSKNSLISVFNSSISFAAPHFLTSKSSDFTISNTTIMSAMASSLLVLQNSSFFLYQSLISSNTPANLIQIPQSANSIKIMLSKFNQISLQDVLFTANLLLCDTPGCKNTEFEECEDGFINLQGCRACNDGSYAIQLFKPKSCFECTDLMICENKELKPKMYVYRYTESKYLKVFRKCLEPAACLDVRLDKDLGLFATQCSEGYVGRLCHSCHQGYTKVSSNICAKCPDKYKNILVLGAIIVVALVIIYYLVSTTIKTSFQPEKLHSIGLKIFLDYVQVIFICLQYKLKWPQHIHQIATQSSNDNESKSSLEYYYFSLKCLFKPDLRENELFYYRVYFMVSLPLILFLFSFLFLGIMKISSRSVEKYKAIVFIIPILLVYPNVISYALSPLSCRSLITGKSHTFNENVVDYPSFLIENADIWCSEGEHVQKSAAAVAGGVFIWGIGLPAVIFFKLFKRRKNLFSEDAKNKYGFLFNGYKHSRYYWELVILSKKLILVVITVLMQSSFQQNTQSVIIVLLLSSYLLLQLIFSPYIIEPLNAISTYAGLASLITIISGISYSESSTSFRTEIMLSILIISVNLAFIYLWSKFMLKEVLNYLRLKFKYFKENTGVSDGFDEDISKELMRIRFAYIKEYHTIFTMVDTDLPQGSDYYLTGLNTCKDLYTMIIKTDQELYINNIQPKARIGRRISYLKFS